MVPVRLRPLGARPVPPTPLRLKRIPPSPSAGTPYRLAPEGNLFGIRHLPYGLKLRPVPLHSQWTDPSHGRFPFSLTLEKPAISAPASGSPDPTGSPQKGAAAPAPYRRFPSGPKRFLSPSLEVGMPRTARLRLASWGVDPFSEGIRIPGWFRFSRPFGRTACRPKAHRPRLSALSFWIIRWRSLCSSWTR
jgi:hypothetical protein